MKLVLRTRNKIQLTVIQTEPELEHPQENPEVYTPLSLRYTWRKIDRGFNDMPVVYRGDQVPMEVTLLDFRGNPLPDLGSMGVLVQMAVKQTVPFPQQLFVIDGSVLDVLTGKVGFILTASETDQAGVDEAIMNIRVSVSGGDPVTFEDVYISFRDSAFTT